MAGFFTLMLDTTSPKIEIYAPPYSNNTTLNEIRVVSNEDLSEFQNIYIIDGIGARHDVIFSKVDAKEYYGEIVFSDYPIGIATIYAQLKDDVGNLSDLTYKTINIVSSIDSLLMNLHIYEQINNLATREQMHNIITYEDINHILIYEHPRDLKLYEAMNSLDIKDETSLKMTISDH